MGSPALRALPWALSPSLGETALKNKEQSVKLWQHSTETLQKLVDICNGSI